MSPRWKSALILALVLASGSGGVLYTIGAFNAQTRNPSSALASGSIVLLNTKQGGTTCASTAGGTTNSNVNTGCDQLLNLAAQKPGDNSTARITLKNDGSINASALQLYTSSCVSSDTSGETYHGTGDMCSVVQLYVQRYSDASFTTKSSCLYGGGTATVCDFSDATKTISTFATAYTSSAPLGLGALNAGSSAYIEFGVQLPSGASNSYQGRTATFDFTQLLVQ